METHHLQQLGQGGADNPDNIVVLCANHHRMFHYAISELVSRSPEFLVVRVNDKKMSLSLKHHP